MYRRIALLHDTFFALRAAVSNAMHHPTFSAPVTNVETGDFGSVTSLSYSPLQTQFAVKFAF